MIQIESVSYPFLDDSEFEELKITESMRAQQCVYKLEESKNQPMLDQVDSVADQVPESIQVNPVGNPSPADEKRASNLLAEFFQATIVAGEKGNP